MKLKPALEIRLHKQKEKKENLIWKRMRGWSPEAASIIAISTLLLHQGRTVFRLAAPTEPRWRLDKLDQNPNSWSLALNREVLFMQNYSTMIPGKIFEFRQWEATDKTSWSNLVNRIWANWLFKFLWLSPSLSEKVVLNLRIQSLKAIYFSISFEVTCHG